MAAFSFWVSCKDVKILSLHQLDSSLTTLVCLRNLVEIIFYNLPFFCVSNYILKAKRGQKKQNVFGGSMQHLIIPTAPEIRHLLRAAYIF